MNHPKSMFQLSGVHYNSVGFKSMGILKGLYTGQLINLARGLRQGTVDFELLQPVQGHEERNMNT